MEAAAAGAGASARAGAGEGWGWAGEAATTGAGAGVFEGSAAGGWATEHEDRYTMRQQSRAGAAAISFDEVVKRSMVGRCRLTL